MIKGQLSNRLSSANRSIDRPRLRLGHDHTKHVHVHVWIAGFAKRSALRTRRALAPKGGPHHASFSNSQRPSTKLQSRALDKTRPESTAGHTRPCVIRLGIRDTKPTGTTSLGLVKIRHWARDEFYHMSRKTRMTQHTPQRTKTTRTTDHVGEKRNISQPREDFPTTPETLFQNLKALQELYVDNDFHA